MIEFVTRDDPMVQTLLRNERDQYDDYHREYFERGLSEAFDFVKCEVLGSGPHILYYGKARVR